MTTPDTEVRCPLGPGRLFAKLVHEGPLPALPITEGNLIEFACSDCRRSLRDGTVVRVLHRYDFAGSLIETEVVRA